MRQQATGLDHIKTVLAMAFIGGVVGISAADLKVGDPAPEGEFDIKPWILPNEDGVVVDMKDGKVHVVEFWATWCVPCRFSIPHLSRLQEEWGEDRLQIIGVTDEEVEDVRPWIDSNKAQIKYAIGISGRRGPQRTWFKEADLSGIPAAFIVGPRGRIQFIGNPNGEDFEMTLIKVLQGRFDASLQREAAPLFTTLRKQKQAKNWIQYEKVANQIIAIDPKVFVDTQIDLYETRLVDMKDPEGAAAMGAAFANTGLDSDPEGLLLLAERIAVSPRIPDGSRDLDFALEITTKAEERMETPRSKAQSLATKAAVQYKMGQVRDAISTARKAYRLAPESVKEDYREQWVEYKRSGGA
ncbi:MAG: TlpA family protein disulfide reductase [Phycisphaerales bacterium]|nr:TlpA family protein disulfide reductase [Phycisphaerales bacterium]